MDVIEYCAEEVLRQGHDLTRLDGIERVGWMLDGWAYALKKSLEPNAQILGPRTIDIINIGRRIEPEKNQTGPRRSGVQVGGRTCPASKDVPDLLTDLFGRIMALEPLDAYREFEMIHPFSDGNGRTGKILLNWLNQSLLKPIFPPQDFWGEAIRNP